jgi:predicted NUDIX family phosphoesterase
MHPNGDVVVRAHGVSYNVIFGNKEVFVSGEMNVTVNGGGSLRVEGDYNVTVAGNMNTVVSGNMETVVNGNNNLLVNGDMDTAIDGSQTTKVAGNSEHTSEGKTYIGSHEGLALEATGGNLRVAANDNMNVRVGGTYEAESDGGTTIIGETIDLNP